MTYQNCPRNQLIIGPDEKELLAEIEALLARAAAHQDGLTVDDMWIKVTTPRRIPGLPVGPITREIVTRGDRVVMTIPPEGDPKPTEDIFLRRFPSDGDRVPEGSGAVRTQTLQEAKDAVIEAEKKALDEILSGGVKNPGIRL